MSAAPLPPSRAVTRSALIAAIAPAADRLARLLSDPQVAAAVDWDWLIERAMTHRVGALTAARIAGLTVAPHLPESALAQLDDIRRQAAERAAASQHTLRELAAALQSRAIPFLLVKGSLLAELVYRDPLIRPFYDVDVVIRRDALPAAEALLSSWGYRLHGAWPLLGARPSPPVALDIAEDIARRFYLRGFHNFSYAPAHDDPRRPIELHWHIVPRGRLRVREEQLWERTTTAHAAGIEVRTLDPEATLIHLSVHALEAWFHGFKLLHLGDVAWTVARGAQPYRDLWELADAWGATYHLELALRLADRLFPAPAAGALLAGRRPSAWMRAALRFSSGERLLVDRSAGPGAPWLRRSALELAWGLAVHGLRTKLDFSLSRRIAAARWRVAHRRATRRLA